MRSGVVAAAMTATAAAAMMGCSSDSATAATVAAMMPAGLQGKTTLAESDDLSHKLYADEQRTVSLFERCSASVVHINTSIEKRVLVPGQGGYHLNLQEIPQGQGSGFLWDSQHVVTNYHVIKDAEKAVIVLADNTHCEATLVGAEPDCDLAVLKVGSSRSSPRQSLQPLERGRSGNLHVGQRVYAIGNPFGLDQTLTSGIVSGLGREVRGVNGNTIRGVIQTDAAINPGNSGGPLLDARGRLIGVNTMIASPSGAFSGVGFAIPVDTVVRVVQQLVQYGRMRHAYLGVYCAPDHVAKRISNELRDGGLTGVLVLNIEPESPADKAGLRPTSRMRDGIRLGDEIIEVNGKKVSSAEELTETVNSYNIGDEVELLCGRRGEQDSMKTFRTKVKLTERPRRFEQVSNLAAPSQSTPGQLVQEDAQPRLRSRM